MKSLLIQLTILLSFQFLISNNANAQGQEVVGMTTLTDSVTHQLLITNPGVGGSDWYLSSSRDAWNAGRGKFLINNVTNSSQSKFVITPEGNVGIGVVAPKSKLSVDGKINIGFGDMHISEGDIRYNPTTNEFEGYNGTSWGSFSGGGGITNKIENLDQNSKVQVWENASSDYIRFDLDGDERLRLLDNANNEPRLEFYSTGNNISIGDDAGLLQKSTGTDNIAIGTKALESNAIGDKNVAIGTEALANANFDNSTTGIPFGSEHVAVGYKALHQISGTAIGNTAIGHKAGEMSDDSYSVYVGHMAGQDGGSGVFIGNSAGVNTTLTKTNALFIADGPGDKPLLYGQFNSNYLRTNGVFDVLSEGDGLVNNTDKDLIASFRSTSEHPTILFSAGGSSLFDGMSIEYNGSSTIAQKKMHINDRDADPILTIMEGNTTTPAKVGINNDSPTGVLHVEGDAYITGIPTPGGFASDLHITAAGRIIKSTSDVRLKTDIRTIENALDKVIQLRGTSFEWKNGPNPNRTLGVIAQEALEVVPDIVTTGDEYYGVNYSEIPALLIEAIKEQQKIIQYLESRISILESSNHSN